MERKKERGALAPETKNKTSPMPPTIAKSGSRKMADCLRVIIGLFLLRCDWLGLRRSRTLDTTQIFVCIQTLRLFFQRLSWDYNYSGGFGFYHGLRGSASPVLTATGFVNGRCKFSTPDRINTHWPITEKFGTGDYVAAPRAAPNLVQIPRWGASGQMGEI